MTFPPLAILIVLLGICSCATPTRSQDWLGDELARRIGHRGQLGSNDNGARTLPPRIVLDNGIDEEEAVALALWNNPSFAAMLTRLQRARADVIEAGQVENPRLTALAPIGPITASVSLLAPVLSLLQRGQRTKASQRSLESVAESLVQSGLDLVRDVRVAHIDLAWRFRRLGIAKSLAVNSIQLLEFTRARSSEGDISTAELLLLDAESAMSRDQVAVAQQERTVALERLRELIGGGLPGEVLPNFTSVLPDEVPPLGTLLPTARGCRPSIRAAELELEATAVRAGWEQSRIATLSMQVDLQWNASNFGGRIGAAGEIPIFNQNQSGIDRAEAAIEAALRRVSAASLRVALEVATAHAQLGQALGSLKRYHLDVVPALNGAVAAATSRYELGDKSHFELLSTMKRLGLARRREADLEAQVRRTHAELERAVGGRVGASGEKS